MSDRNERLPRVMQCSMCDFRPTKPPGQYGELCAWCQRGHYVEVIAHPAETKETQ